MVNRTLNILDELGKKVEEIRAAHEDEWSLEYLLEWLEELIVRKTW